MKMRTIAPLALTIFALVACTTPGPRISYALERSGDLLISSSPNFDHPVLTRNDHTVTIHTGWVIKNVGNSPVTLSPAKGELELRKKQLPITCKVNDKPVVEQVVKKDEKILLECESTIDRVAKGEADDEKAIFHIPYNQSRSFPGIVYIRAEDFE